MGLFTSKIAAGVLAGGFTLAGAGLLFTGSDTLTNASNFVKDAGQRLTQYEQNEGNLLTKIGLIKADASSKLSAANEAITDLKGQIVTLNGEITALTDAKAALEVTVADLNVQIEGLSADITELEAILATEQGNHAETRAQLDAKTAEYNAKVAKLAAVEADLASANKEISDLNTAINVAQQKVAEADIHVTKLENEMIKANAEVKAHGDVVEEVKADTDADQPMSQDEIDAVDTTVE